MRASEVAAKEADFHAANLNAGHARAATFRGVPVFDYKHPARNNYHFTERPAKSLVVLHFTAGWFWGDLPTLTTDEFHVSVAFLISRGGLIYRLFDSGMWSNHLGKESQVIGGNIFNSKRSVAIELSNVGPLEPNGNDLTFVGRTYCTTSETGFYTRLSQPFRGARHFATFTDAQYRSLDALLTAISAEHGIARRFLPPETRFLRFATADDARGHRGIASHVNYRPTGKWDIGPAFDWTRIGG